MKFDINYSEESFKRYMSRKKIPHLITKTENIIYHELGHLRDMLDPRYNYGSGRVDRMSNEAFKKFVTIWNINIDSRLNNKGLPSAIRGRKEDIRYFHIPDEMVKKIWNKFVNFAEMAKMARKL